MGVLFAQTKIGTAVAFQSPDNALGVGSFNVRNRPHRSWSSGLNPALLAAVLGPIGYLFTAQASDIGSDIGLAARQQFAGDSINTFSEGNADPTPQRADSKRRANPDDPPEWDIYRNLANGRWGYIIGMDGGFSEKYESNGLTIESYGAYQMGGFSLRGIAFGTICRGTSTDRTGTDARSGKAYDRHGLEGILHFYYYNRVSYEFGAGPNRLSIKLGSTDFPECFVVSLNMVPQDPKFNIWSWEIGLAVAPEYRPVPLT